MKRLTKMIFGLAIVLLMALATWKIKELTFINPTVP